jgi:hypothetical protein
MRCLPARQITASIPWCGFLLIGDQWSQRHDRLRESRPRLNHYWLTIKDAG